MKSSPKMKRVLDHLLGVDLRTESLSDEGKGAKVQRSSPEASQQTPPVSEQRPQADVVQALDGVLTRAADSVMHIIKYSGLDVQGTSRAAVDRFGDLLGVQ